ncbi:MAG TPA: lipoprotein [Luteimonas sp.]|nr:lipoprotein [Luteimonas sp.]HRP72229.1 lipoprotein [Luteimonas sp.]
MRKSSLLLAPLALVLALNLVACGNKGPLVRPSVDDVEEYDAVEDVDEEATDAADADPEVDPQTMDEATDDSGDPSIPPDAGNG